MKRNLNQVRSKSSGKSPPTQSQNRSLVARSTRTPDLLEAGSRTVAAIEEMKKAGTAAIAAILANADMIKHHVAAYAEWADFDMPGFTSGMLELANSTATRFTTAFNLWQSYLLLLVAWRSGDEGARIEERFNVPKTLQEIEEAVWSLHFCVTLQGYMMEARTCADGSGYFAIQVGERLRLSWEAAWACRGDLCGIPTERGASCNG
jgi:hypothetical protein